MEIKERPNPEPTVDSVESVVLTVLPLPAYSSIDQNSGLSSTRWLLNQPPEFQTLHVPIPYEAQPLHPVFPTPTRFGEPVEAGGWRNRVPSWIFVIPTLARLNFTTKVCHIGPLGGGHCSLAQFKSYEPPVQLSRGEIRRLKIYGGLPYTPTLPNTPLFPPEGGSAVPNVSSSTVSGSSSQHPPGQGSGDSVYGGATFGLEPTGATFQTLYSTDVVKEALQNLYHKSVPKML
jgi:hypothetical protein